MTVWRITGNEIGPNGNGAAYFSLKIEAARALRDHGSGSGPEKIVITNSQQLAAALNDAMGYGVT